MKNLEAQVDQHVQELKEQPTMTRPGDTLTNFNESMDISLSTMQGLPSLKVVEQSEIELEIENKVLLSNLEDEGMR